MGHRQLGCCLLSLVLVALVGAESPVRADVIPDWLPHYDLGIHLDNVHHVVTVQQRVKWTNRHARPASELVFNVYPRYKVPKEDVVLMVKTLELLRAAPGEAADLDGRRLEVHKVTLADTEKALTFHWKEDNQTAMVVSLPQPVKQGESVLVEIAFTLDLPRKQGRWGYYRDTTFLSNWCPTLAYYDDTGWQPMPFVAWHQPFFNEAGVYSVRLTLPCDQKIASTGSIQREEDLGDGYKRVEIVGCCARDFALVCSNRFKEWVGHAERTRVRVLAFPEHEYLARKALEFACEAIPIYNRWFGTYPYDEFDIVQAQFPWNGNECSGLIMIDERVFGMPSIGETYVDHLVSHETLHQWWYNVVGTNGYCETWMDESVVAYYTSRRMRAKYGINAPWLRYPKCLQWLPNIRHDTYLLNGMYGTLGRGEGTATVMPLPEFGNIVTLFSMTYDRGAKILSIIEERLGEDAFKDFMKLVYSKYQFRILRVADFQRELEAYTGTSWEAFFKQWLYSKGMSDWAVVGADVQPLEGAEGAWRAVVTLRQKAEFSEPTVLGVMLKKDGPYELRLPVCPSANVIQNEDPPSRCETLPDGTIRVEVTLPCKPVQMSVDPDQILPDADPANNHWKPEINWRLTPLYTNLDETDLTTDYDRWNVILGPWVGSNAPPFGQRGYTGIRLGTYRLQKFRGGTYLAYDIDDQDIVVGADAIVDHWPLPYSQVGAQFDHSLVPEWAAARQDRGKIFGRYILHYTPSLYLDQMEYVEVYGRWENQFWSEQGPPPPGIETYDDSASVGIRYERFYLTPYWDPVGGYWFWASYEYGVPFLGGDETFQRLEGQVSYVQSLPDGLGYLSRTRLAARLYGGGSLPDNGQMFWLGGANRLRGLRRWDREGSLVWISSLEWRFPVWCNIDYACCDQTFAFRNLYGALFYDVGDIYINGRSVGGIAHSVGAGLRLDTAFFGFVDRMTFRFDVAKVVNDNNEPVQFWFAISQPF